MKVAAFVRLLLMLFAFLCTGCLVQPPDNRGPDDDDSSDDDDTSDDDDISDDDDDDIPSLSGTFFGDLEGAITVEGEEFPCVSWGVATFGQGNTVESGVLRCDVNDQWMSQEVEVALSGLQVPGAVKMEETLWGLSTFVSLKILIEEDNSTGLSVEWTGFDGGWTDAELFVTGVLRAEP